MIVDKKNKLSLLNEELKYLEIEYLEKMGINKQHSLNQVLDEFKELFKQNEFDFLVNSNSKLAVKKGTNIVEIKQTVDFRKHPKGNRQLDLTIKNENKEVLKVTIRLFIDESKTSLPQPDLNRLLTNPYEGMDSVEIEIHERQKSVDYMKRYISESENYCWNYLCVNHSNNHQKLYESMDNLFNEIVHNRR